MATFKLQFLLPVQAMTAKDLAHLLKTENFKKDSIYHRKAKAIRLHSKSGHTEKA